MEYLALLHHFLFKIIIIHRKLPYREVALAARLTSMPLVAPDGHVVIAMGRAHQTAFWTSLILGASLFWQVLEEMLVFVVICMRL